MSYEIEIKDAKVVVITFTGESDLEENLMAREELLKINDELGLYYAISDWRDATISQGVSAKEYLAFWKTWPKQLMANHL